MWKWDRPLGPWPSSSSYYYYYPIPPEGEWDLVVVWFHLSYYYPIPPEGEWDLVVVWFHLSYYYYYRRSSSKGFCVVFVLNNGDISLISQDISMKLGGHIGHGPNSSYRHF